MLKRFCYRYAHPEPWSFWTISPRTKTPKQKKRLAGQDAGSCSVVRGKRPNLGFFTSLRPGPQSHRNGVLNAQSKPAPHWRSQAFGGVKALIGASVSRRGDPEELRWTMSTAECRSAWRSACLRSRCMIRPVRRSIKAVVGGSRGGMAGAGSLLALEDDSGFAVLMDGTGQSFVGLSGLAGLGARLWK